MRKDLNRIMRARGWLFSVTAVFLLMYLQNAKAVEMIMGWEGARTHGYGFVSPVMTLQREEAVSWLLRASASYLYYDSHSSTGITEVRSPGQSLSIAARHADPKLSATLGLGYEIRQKTQYPASGSATKINERGVVYQGDLFFQAAPLTKLSLIGSYSQANHYFGVRGGAKRQISNPEQEGDTVLNAGVELARHGNRHLYTSKFGGIVEMAYPRSHASLQFRFGRSNISYADGSSDSENYLGIGSYWTF